MKPKKNSFPSIQQHFTPKTGVILLVTVLLHFFFLQSAAWKEWTPIKQSGLQRPIQVSLQPIENPNPPQTIEPQKNLPQKVGRKKAASPNAIKPISEDAPPIEKAPIPIPEAPSESVNNPPISQESAEKLGEEAITGNAPEFALRVPESVMMQMEVTHTKANGNPTVGVGSIRWDIYKARYKIVIEVGINALITTINLFQMTSEGEVTEFGITPMMSTDVRKARASTAIHFNHKEKTIIFSSSNKTVKMENGAQDGASVLFQLAAIGYADPKQFGAGKTFSIQVAEGRDANPYTFIVNGEEEIDSKLDQVKGKLTTIHITRPPMPGTYNSTLDIWLAPSLGWYPVQIRNTESNGNVTNQVVTHLFQKINMER